MRQVRRERIRELIGMLEYIHERVETHCLAEEAFPPLEGTEQGIVSKEAVESLERAASSIYDALDELRSAIGDNSKPEPDPITVKRRRI